MKWVTCAFVAVVAAAGASVGCGDKAEEARREADSKTADATKEAREAQEAAAKAVAAQKVATDETARAAHTEARAKMQKDVEAADRKITYLKEKAAKATGAAKKNADTAVAELDKRRDTVRADLAKLDLETGAAWDTAKAGAERSLTALNQAVDNLETTVAAKTR